MGGDVNSSDSVGYFAASIEETYELVITGAGVSISSQAKGPLQPGRWIAQLRTSNTEDYAWIRTRGHIAVGSGAALVALVTEGPARFPLSVQGFLGVEFHIKKGINDEVAVITELAPGRLYLSRVSRDG